MIRDWNKVIEGVKWIVFWAEEAVSAKVLRQNFTFHENNVRI